MKMRRAIQVAAIAALAATATTGLSTSASATQYAGCYARNVCFYYSPSYAGARTGFDDGNIPDLLNPRYLFPNNGSGGGGPVGNNAASAKNTIPDHVARIYYSVNFTGQQVYLGPNTGIANLGALRNNNRSFLTSE